MIQNQINQSSNTNISTKDGASIKTIQWQKLNGANWTNISGATQLSYDPSSITGDTKYRRIVTSSSGATNISEPILITKIFEEISSNIVCYCNYTTDVMPFDPPELGYYRPSSNLGSSVTLSYQWQQTNALSVYVNISGATNMSYNPPLIKNQTLFRRVVTSSTGLSNISEPAAILLNPCNRAADEQNTICGDQTFYKIQHGDTINPGLILSSFDTPDIERREFGYEFMISYNGVNWTSVKPKQLASIVQQSRWNVDKNPEMIKYKPYQYIPNLITTWQLFSHLSYKQYYPNELRLEREITGYDFNKLKARPIVLGFMDYQPASFIFDITRGNIQHIYIKRDYYEWYDPFDCGPWGAPGPCKSSWY